MASNYLDQAIPSMSLLLRQPKPKGKLRGVVLEPRAITGP